MLNPSFLSGTSRVLFLFFSCFFLIDEVKGQEFIEASLNSKREHTLCVLFAFVCVHVCVDVHACFLNIILNIFMLTQATGPHKSVFWHEMFKNLLF